ncbi:MAG: ABC transporter ATP-binding protein [Candidatus Limiplasma sp.]|nr:ABC transporter ATP-binding protein [Candidatus Limiplasma sp.]
MAANVLHLENITMQFGGVVAVNSVCMDVNEGEIVALIGPNGAGKTTVFNVITGVYAPTNGRVSLRGKVIAEDHPRGKMRKLYTGGHLYEYNHTVSNTPDQITKLGMARTFQNIRLFKSMSVFDNVLVARHMHLKANFFSDALHINAREEARMREDTMQLLDIVGLADVHDEIATSLPYGQQRRLEIARALSTNPSMLLLDEPAAGMNPQETENLSSFIRDIKERFGLTVLLIEHDINLVMDISERIYVLNFGKLIAEGTPAKIQSNPDVITAYLGVAEE